jgi:hypothetical protein
MYKRPFLFVTLLLSVSLFAQDDLSTLNQRKYRGGIKLGRSTSHVAVSNGGVNGVAPTSLRPQSGLIAGGYYRIRLRRTLAFQPEFFFIAKGWEEDGYIDYPSNYFELPLNLLYTAFGKKGSTFYLGGGPAPAINMNQQGYFGSYTTVKQFDLGVNFLAGYEIPIGFALNVQYTYGVLNINTLGDGPVLKNRCFGVTIGYTF